MPPERVFFVRNVMIDMLPQHRERAWQSDIQGKLEITPGRYAVCTLHRPNNVDALGQVALHLPIVLSHICGGRMQSRLLQLL
jgi:UDP-N-acetylglucosamine 2-epimerase